MSWGRSPSQGLGALGRSPFKGEGAPGGGGGGGVGREGNEWTLLDERVTASRGPASCSPSSSSSSSREFLMMAEHRRRSMSMDIPHAHQQHHGGSGGAHGSHGGHAPLHAQQQQQHAHHYPHTHHHRPSSFNSSPGTVSSLAREFSSLGTSSGGGGGGGCGGGSGSGGFASALRDRSYSMDGSGSGSTSATALRSGTSSASSSSVASASETSTGATGAGTSEVTLQRQYRARLEEAEQQTAYWQARAKEAEQATLKYKTEAVTLRCQLNAQQCTMTSLDEVLLSIHGRLERVMAQLGVRCLGASAGVGGGRRGGPSDRQQQPRTVVLENIEQGLMELEKRVAAGDGGGEGALTSSSSGVTNNAAAAGATSSSLPSAVIHFRRFAPGDLALFFPTPAGDYLAFNVGAPHHYLSEEAKALIGKDKHFRKYYVLGRITRLVKCQVPTVEEEVAAAGGSGSVSSAINNARPGPYNLAAGCRYAVVSVEPIKGLSESSSKGSSSSSSKHRS